MKAVPVDREFFRSVKNYVLVESLDIEEAVDVDELYNEITNFGFRNGAEDENGLILIKFPMISREIFYSYEEIFQKSREIFQNRS